MIFVLEFFLIGVILGCLIYYLFFSEATIVFKNPVPNENNPTTYIDDNGVCYKYKTVKVACSNQQN